jgi:hypothetical protein
LQPTKKGVKNWDSDLDSSYRRQNTKKNNFLKNNKTFISLSLCLSPFLAIMCKYAVELHKGYKLFFSPNLKRLFVGCSKDRSSVSKSHRLWYGSITSKEAAEKVCASVKNPYSYS